MIVGVPSNDFGGQEPGTADDIKHTAHGEYGVGFPLAAKAQVKGPNPHPFYKWAASERPLETPRWNFHKYLVGRDGHIAAVFPTASSRWMRASSTPSPRSFRACRNKLPAPQR